MTFRRRSRSLSIHLIGPLVGLLLLFILWFFYLSFRFQREYQELNRQLLINSDIGKSTALVMQTRGRVREVLLHYRMTRAQRYLQELSTLNQQMEMHLERIVAFGEAEPSRKNLSRALVSGLRASDFLRGEMVLAVQERRFDRADRAFEGLTTLYEINSARMKDYSLSVESDLYRLQHQLRTLLLRTFWLSLFTIVIVALSIWVIGSFYQRNLLGPLRALHSGLKALSGGNFAVRVPVARAPEEILEMTLDFNKMASALRSTHQEMTSAIRARDEFLSIASHELKTPLTSLKLQAQLYSRAIQKGDESVLSEERVAALAQQTEKQVGRLTRLVDDMLDVSRIQFGKLNLKKEFFELSPLVTELITGMREQFESAGCPLPAVDPCPESSGNWDRLRIEQVVTNLLTNALRYGNRKPVNVTIQARAGWVELRVRDQGIGIEPQNLKVIFDRFERAVNSNEVSGLGLGLFITRQIVLAHHGRIVVDSEIGKGSVFTVQLPRGH
jgi:signal transduction histidine kinase